MKYCGKHFSEAEMSVIRRIIEEDPARNRLAISPMVCDELGWRKPDGGLKEMSCRVALLRMHEDELVRLPPPRIEAPRRGRQAPSRRLAQALRLPPRSPGNLRRKAAIPWDLLQGRQLAMYRRYTRPRQARPPQALRPSHQERVALPPLTPIPPDPNPVTSSFLAEIMWPCVPLLRIPGS